MNVLEWVLLIGGLVVMVWAFALLIRAERTLRRVRRAADEVDAGQVDG